MPALVFFPRVSIREPIELPGLRLIPFELDRRTPQDLPNVSFETISAVLSPYHDYMDHRVRSATLVEINEWQSGADFPDDRVASLLDVRHLIGFSMLARRIFTSYSDYCNFDCFELAAQRYDRDVPHAFALVTRTRTGTVSHLWDANSYPFRRPLHVPKAEIVNTDLLRCVASADFTTQSGRRMRSAIQDFNFANTNAPGAHEHVEMVMIASAFEFLFGTDDPKKIASRLIALIAPFNQPIPAAQQSAAQNWLTGEEAGASLLEGWWYDLRRWRGDGAHGNKRGQKLHHWSMRNHALFASRLFPLLVKAQLAEQKLFTLEGIDIASLALVERFLLHDHFAPQKSIRFWDKTEEEILTEYRSKWLSN